MAPLLPLEAPPELREHADVVDAFYEFCQPDARRARNAAAELATVCGLAASRDLPRS